MSNPLSLLLRYCARNGRWILVASLVLGLTASDLALLIKPHIATLIALLLFTACLRVGPKQALGAGRDIKASFVFTIILQILLPLIVVLITMLLGLNNTLTFALVLLMAAPSLSGSPHLVVLMGFEPSHALRQLIVGTALLPLTIIPVFALLPEIGDLTAVVTAALRLLMIILVAAAAAFTIRLTVMKEPPAEVIEQVDGVSTILLAITVIGLMTAIRSELAGDPLNLLIVLTVAFIANIGMQVVSALILARSQASAYTVPIGIISGNRNIALFLTALPAATTEPLLLFIGCYQIPMYLTPIIMRRFYQRIAGPQG